MHCCSIAETNPAQCNLPSLLVLPLALHVVSTVGGLTKWSNPWEISCRNLFKLICGRCIFQLFVNGWHPLNRVQRFFFFLNSACLKGKNRHKGSVRGAAYLSGGKSKNYRQGRSFIVADSSEVNQTVSKMQGVRYKLEENISHWRIEWRTK